MKNCLILAVAQLAWAAFPGLAQDSAPRLLGVVTPAAEAVPTPETTVLQGLSDDGRWLLLTSASDRLTTNDHNAALDVFLFDCAAGKAALVSAGANGVSGNGTSLAGAMTPDAGRVAFLSRAPDLASPDTNATWDVFVRDVANGTNLLATSASNGGSSVGPAGEPLISVDGRYVVFRSLARDLAPGAFLSTDNLYRRDLVEDSTECLTTNLPSAAPGPWRLRGFALAPDAQTLVVNVVNAFVPTATVYTNLIVWQDLATGQSTNCSATLPPELLSASSVTHEAPAISANGQFVAFRSEVKVSSVLREALCRYDLQQNATSILDLRTNDPAQQVFSASAFNAALSADGRYVVYSAPLPTYDPSASVLTNGPMQVYLYDAQAQSSFLVSAAPDGAPADADASNALIAPDGRGVAFLSAAQNLVAGATNQGLRAYWFDREAGRLQPVAELGAVSLRDTSTVLSANGDWLAVSAPGEAGVTTIHVFDTRNQTASALNLAPQIGESSTARGWIGVRPEGVSADGRYVALTAFPPA